MSVGMDGQTRANLLRDLDAMDWYRKCLEDKAERRPVLGFQEAKSNYFSAFGRLAEALDPESQLISDVERLRAALTHIAGYAIEDDASLNHIHFVASCALEGDDDREDDGLPRPGDLGPLGGGV